MAAAGTATAPAADRQNRAFIAVVIVALILLGLFAIAVRALLQQRLEGNEANAIAGIRVMNTALYQHRQKHGDAYPKSAAELRDSIDANLACGQPTCVKAGYNFAYQLGAPTAMGPRYTIVARPNAFGNTGRRSFYSDESGVVRATDEDRPATANDGPVS